MGRRKFTATKVVEPFKLSVILPPDLYQRLEDHRAERGEEISRVVRELLESGLEAGKPRQGTQSMDASTSTTGGLGEEELVLTIRLTGAYRECLTRASELHNLEPVALAQLILTENIAAYITKGRERQEEIRRLVSGEQQGP
jgi:hypothetical protein